MKNYSIEISLISLLLFVPMLIFWVYGDKLLIRRPEPAPISAINLILGASSASNPRPTKPAIPTRTPTPTRTQASIARAAGAAVAVNIRPTQTPLPRPTDEPTAAPRATNTPTFGEMLKDHIVFYLIQPELGHEDACGNIQLVPIISRRMRTGDKLYDVQVALEMLFNLKRKIYIKWYNALWDTDLTIDKYQYVASKDRMSISFSGYLPSGQLSGCDSHGIKEQILTTFSHYGIQGKSFTINGLSFP